MQAQYAKNQNYHQHPQTNHHEQPETCHIIRWCWGCLKKPKIAITDDNMDESKVGNEGEGKGKKKGKGKDGKDKGKKAKNLR